MITEKQIAGALRDCINSHGPITASRIGSAAKRIYVQIKVNERKTKTVQVQKFGDRVTRVIRVPIDG